MGSRTENEIAMVLKVDETGCKRKPCDVEVTVAVSQTPAVVDRRSLMGVANSCAQAAFSANAAVHL